MGGGRGSKPEGGGGMSRFVPIIKKKGGGVSRTEGGKGAQNVFTPFKVGHKQFYSVLRAPQKGFDL